MRTITKALIIPRKTQRLVSSSVAVRQPMIVRPDIVENEVIAVPNNFIDKTIQTVDISVSKLFPGGFGWQAASVFAANQGLKATDTAFALMTGIGDAFGVAVGHLAFSAIKSVFTGSNVRKEIPVATWLGAAAFCSGSLWQPAVNLFVGLGFNFPAVFLLTGAFCATAFFAGLRLGRRAFQGIGIQPPTSNNLSEDAGLSVAIGGAAAMFVSTDVTIPKNPLDTIFGVFPTTSSIEGCLRAGASTATGFAVLHTIQNSRAPETGFYLTRDTFVDVSTAVADEIVRINPETQSAVQTFLDEHVEEVFGRFDKNGDGRLTQAELHEQSVALRDYIAKMKNATNKSA